MQTRLPEALARSDDGRAADEILRKCVHCGFCTAVCPTYRLGGNELDSPRGRIYLIKSLLEGEPAGGHTRQHLDRCLGCRACETVCPSEVDYHRLLDIGREQLDARAPRPLLPRLGRRLLRAALASPAALRALVGAGRRVAPVLPRALAALVPPAQRPGEWPRPGPGPQVLVLRGCVQDVISAGTNAALARVLAAAGFAPEPVDGCCGAVQQHTGGGAAAVALARRNVDAWSARLAPEGRLVVAASGCGAHLRDYAWLLRGDADHAARAQALAPRIVDATELLAPGALAGDGGAGGERVAVHVPCSMQHGLRLGDRVPALLRHCGYEVLEAATPGACCGSAGTYSLLQPRIARALRDERLAELEAGTPSLIVTANVGCQQFLQSGSRLPVLHWSQAVDRALAPAARARAQ